MDSRRAAPAAEELALKVLDTLAAGGDGFAPLYEPEATLTEKIDVISREVYGADGVDYAAGVERRLRRLDHGVARGFPVCMAKTQYSLSDNAALLGRPRGFRITVRDVRLSAGAGFRGAADRRHLDDAGPAAATVCGGYGRGAGRDYFGAGVGRYGPARTAEPDRGSRPKSARCTIEAS